MLLEEARPCSCWSSTGNTAGQWAEGGKCVEERDVDDFLWMDHCDRGCESCRCRLRRCVAHGDALTLLGVGCEDMRGSLC